MRLEFMHCCPHVVSTPGAFVVSVLRFWSHNFIYWASDKLSTRIFKPTTRFIQLPFGEHSFRFAFVVTNVPLTLLIFFWKIYLYWTVTLKKIISLTSFKKNFHLSLVHKHSLYMTHRTMFIYIYYMCVLCNVKEGRDSAATTYWLDSRGVGFRVPIGVRYFLLHVVQACPGAHSPSYPLSTGSRAAWDFNSHTIMKTNTTQ
jgi:hypothetical protein